MGEIKNKGAENPSQEAGNPYPHYLQATQYSSMYSNPNPQNSETKANPNPSGVEPYATATSSAQSYDAYYAQVAAYAHQIGASSATASAGYYQDPNALNSVQNWTIPYAAGTEQLVLGESNSRPWTKKNNKWKTPKKPKVIVQPVWCEVCKIQCNTKDVLDVHKTGKKHKKNLEKLKAALAPAPPAPVVPNNPVIGPQEKPKKRKAKEAAAEDLDTKKKKIMEGGAAADAVRTCDICNVVCNSELVFKYHLAGQKHAAMMKKRKVAAVATTAVQV